MKIYLIVADDPSFHPIVVRDLFEYCKNKYDIIGASVVSADARKLSLRDRIQEQVDLYGVRNVSALALQSIIYRWAKFFGIWQQGAPFDVSIMLNKLNIPIFRTANINDPSHLEHIEKDRPDVIISCNHQIFRKRLLEIPRLACINRHTSLLPHYAGLLPVFWALLHDEPIVGQTIHTMEEMIDGGYIVAQETRVVTPETTLYAAYSQAFASAGKLLGTALDRLSTITSKEEIPAIGKEMEIAQRKYFSYPKKGDADLFRTKRRFFTLRQLMTRVPLSEKYETTLVFPET